MLIISRGRWSINNGVTTGNFIFASRLARARVSRFLANQLVLKAKAKVAMYIVEYIEHWHSFAQKVKMYFMVIIKLSTSVKFLT